MADKLSKYIGRRLQELRKRKGLTQSIVAQRSGINTNYYAKLERGEAVPSVGKLEKILKVLGAKSSDVLPF